MSSAARKAIQFTQIFLQVGEGRLQNDDGNYINYIEDIQNVDSCVDLCSYIHDSIGEKHGNNKCPSNRGIITARNTSLPSTNKIIDTRLSVELVTYRTFDQVDTNQNGRDEHQYPVEKLKTIKVRFTVPNHKCTIKIGFPVMLLCNKDSFRGHVNGARYILKAVYIKLLTLESLTGDNASKALALPKIPCNPDNSNFPIQRFLRTPLPMIVDFEITTCKAQR